MDGTTSNVPRYGSDLFVLDVLHGKRNGYFVEAGALDGLQGSNTLVLERDFGWSGLCVEPDPDLFTGLQQNRNCQTANVCLYDAETEVEFMSGVRGWGGVIDHLPPWHEKHWSRGSVIKVPAVPLGILLERFGAPDVIDYLSLDTEGSEYMILKDFPFSRFRFRVVSIESTRCNELLASKGYELVDNKYNIDAPWEQYFVMR